MLEYKLAWQGVAPFTGAWIEILMEIAKAAGYDVAPFTGAWIEIGIPMPRLMTASRRTLHGCVD